jgi:hypothetical protein
MIDPIFANNGFKLSDLMSGHSGWQEYSRYLLLYFEKVQRYFQVVDSVITLSLLLPQGIRNTTNTCWARVIPTVFIAFALFNQLSVPLVFQ